MQPAPFVLFDDVRNGSARLYHDLREQVVAWRADEIEAALAHVQATAGQWAGLIAYEAGLVLEPRLAPLAAARTGADGPLLWLGRFAEMRSLTPDDVAAWLGQGADEGARLGPLDPQVTPGGYDAAFAAVQDAIVAGDIYQANLTLRLAGTWAGDPRAIYARLRAPSQAAHGALVWDGRSWVLSLSPELFFTCDGTRVTVRPMKGTAPRGRTPAQDEVERATLAANTKDRAENLMILDLMRNDLARVAVPGSVRVEAPFTVETYPTLHTMVSTVQGELLPGLGPVDALRALFPCGSITGAPKIRAMEVIAATERDARGVYCGAVGWITVPDTAAQAGATTGQAAFNVAIRTLRLVPDHPGAPGGRAVAGVGSGVVADSTMLGEWRECLVKGSFLSVSAGAADLIETMAFDPAGGIALLDRHLARLKASARALGYECDAHGLRNAIQALCFDLDAPSRVRLLLARSGAHALEAAPAPAPFTAPLRCALVPLPVSTSDWRLRHKTTDRHFYDDARALAQAAGADEALLLRDDGLITEGSFTSLFVAHEGTLLTPAVEHGLLPGVLRASLLDAGTAREAALRPADLVAAGKFHVGNALRGLMPAVLLGATA